jgi:hypothetical protein
MANATIKVENNTLQMGKEGIITIVHDDTSSDLFYTLKYRVGSSITETQIKSVDKPGDVYWTPSTSFMQYENGQGSVQLTLYCYTYRKKQFVNEYVALSVLTVTLLPPAPTSIRVNSNVWYIGANNAVYVQPVTGFVYDISLTIGEETKILATNIDNTDTGETIYLELPLNTAEMMPNAKQAAAVITCTSKLKSDSSVIGSTTVEVTVDINETADKRPVVTMSIRCVNDLPSKFDGIYLSGKSRVEASYEIETFYTSVDSCETTILGETGYGNPYLSQVLNATGKAEIRGTVTDARGLKTSVTKSISVVEYSRPRIAPGNGQSKVVCERCDQDGFQDPNGIYLSIKASRKYSKVITNGSQKNFCTLYYRYKRASDDEEAYSQLYVLLDANESSDSVAAVIPDVVADNKTAYTVQIIAEDDLGEVDLYTVPILTKFVTAHAPVGGHGFTLGGYHDPAKYDVLDCWFDAQFHGDILIGESGMTLRDYILSVINEGG